MHPYHRARAFALRVQARAEAWADGDVWRGRLYEFLLFGIKQGWACLFSGVMLFLLVATMLFWPSGDGWLTRYDFLFLAALALQCGLIALKLERRDEIIVIGAFHLVGTAMELFKTHMGSWAYPEEAMFRIGGVPLFTGFMYACVGSYMARIMRLLDLRFTHYPALWMTLALAVASYINFFSHHFLWDLRYLLFALSAVLFWRCRVYFTPYRKPRWMPLLVGFVLVAFFIWIAENVGTFAGAWLYPSQKDGWHMVSLEKMGSWYLLMMLSFVLVTLVHKPKGLG